MDGLLTGTGASEAKSCLLLENSQQFSRQASPCLWTHGWVLISSRATKGEIFQFLIILQYLAFCELLFQDFCTTLVPRDKQGRLSVECWDHVEYPRHWNIIICPRDYSRAKEEHGPIYSAREWGVVGSKSGDLLHLWGCTQPQMLTYADRKCQHFNLNQACSP